MHLTTLLLPISLALGAPLELKPPSTKPTLTSSIPPSPHSLVVLSVFNDAECRDPGAGNDVDGGRLDIESGDLCFALGGGDGATGRVKEEGEGDGERKWKWGGLKVVWAREGLGYNSLRVYESLNCTGPWTLEPIRCDTDDGTCACSRIATYNSIKLEV